MDATISKLSVETIISLVSAVGVANFLAIIIVVAIVVNFPSIISSINSSIKNKNYSNKIEEIKQNVVFINKSLSKEEEKFNNIIKSVDNQTNEIKALIAMIDILHDSIVKENSERRDEHLMLTENLEKTSKALTSISMVLRNVISEEDTLRLLSLALGIEASLKNNLIEKSMEAIEHLNLGISVNSVEDNLKNDLNSVWSDFKNKISQFSTPLNMSIFLSEKEGEMWGTGGIFSDLLEIAVRNQDLDKSRKKNAIEKRVNVALRNIHSDLNSFLTKRRKNNA